MSLETLEKLKKAVREYDAEGAASLARKLVEEREDAVRVLAALTETMREIGEGFAKCELWLPDLVGAAQAMQAALPVLEEEIKRIGAKRESLGVVVLGTVFGDIHDIGKAMVGTFLTAGGFEVHDLGVNVRAEQFLEAVVQYGADILAMSALLTTTAAEQRKAIRLLKEKGIRDRVKIMVGGGAITQEFADDIGADGYDPTAPGAVGLARRLLGK